MNARVRMMALGSVAVLVGLASLVIVLSLDAPVKAAVGDSPVAVSITEGGFDPAVVTVTVGTTVEWTNHTAAPVHLMSGAPFRIFLPLVMQSAGSPDSASALAATGSTRWARGDWADVVIPPGGSYAHAFTEVGIYPYYLQGDPDKAGRVVVEEAPVPDFALAAWPVMQTITRCQNISYTVAVTALHGFAQPVGLEVGGVPAGASVAWGTNPLIPTADTTLSITPSLLSPAGSYPLLITGTGGAVHTAQAELEVVADPKESHIPCLVVVGQTQHPCCPLPPVIVGCVSGTSRTIWWRYDDRGAFIGFDIEIRDGEEVILEASIDISRAQSGAIVSYEGPVWGPYFPDYDERVVNKYNQWGGLVGADVEKVYLESGDRYEMEITDYCPHASGGEIVGYSVGFCGQEFTVGSCP